MTPRAAVDKAMADCIGRGILTDILIHSKVEILDMILEEYNEGKTREYLRKEAREMGWEEGHGNRLIMNAGCFAAFSRGFSSPAEISVPHTPT